MTLPHTSSSRHSLRILTLVAALALPATAWGQDAADKLDRLRPSPDPGRWIVKWAASGEQAFQVDRDQIVDLDRRDIQDEGEYTFGASFTGAFPRYADFSLSPLVTVNPYLFDEQDETSAWSIRARIQRKITIPQDQDLVAARESHGAILPYVSYQYGRSFTGIFDDRQSDDQQFAFGAAFTNVFCAGVNAQTGECAGEPGSEYTVTVSWSELDSSDNENDRRGPKLRVEWQGPAFAGVALWVDASAESRIYSSLLADGGGRVAEAERYTLAAGFDVTDWARRTLGVSEEIEVRIGARWVTVEANRAALERDDFAIVPTISWAR